jgi:hypothetical protein
MSTFFKAESAFLIRGRGMILAGTVLDGMATRGMSVQIEGFPRQLLVDGIEHISTDDQRPNVIGLLFQSSDPDELKLWRSLDVEEKVFKLYAAEEL